MHRLPAMICGRIPRFVMRSNCTQRFFLGSRLRFRCGNDTVAVAMHFAMKNGQIFFSLRKFLAMSLAMQKIASDCGCDAVVYLGADVHDTKEVLENFRPMFYSLEKGGPSSSWLLGGLLESWIQFLSCSPS